VLAAAMATSPVVAITGPRTVGKSTLAIEVTAVDLSPCQHLVSSNVSTASGGEQRVPCLPQSRSAAEK
jgi:ABC-type hemin transport system ATPase subunit